MRISDWSADVCSSDLGSASTGVRKTPETAANAQTTALTAADADGFFAATEKELFDFSVFNAQVQWINNTYITDDTDAVAARVGAQGTEMTSEERRVGET